MGLINCNVCENKISENAYTCPHCGDHIRDHEANILALKLNQDSMKINSEAIKRTKYFKLFFGTAIAYFIFSMIYLLAGLISN